MNEKILLAKNKGKISLNDSSFLNIQFKGSKKLLPYTTVDSLINQYEQYETERENSNIIRLTCSINPICSNVLFNRVTEIVNYEGSSSAVCLNYSNENVKYVHQTTPSSSNTCVYHCGLDIFNNHFLRSSTFKCVETHGVSKSEVDVFNTLFDYVRNYSGDKKKFYKDNSGSLDNNLSYERLHLYTKNDVLSFYDTINSKLIEKDGWLGFVNEPRMTSESVNNTFINRPILNKKACQFIDLYPERDLFYFTPKYNSYRHREEKNWNYCLTYPYSSTTENIPFIKVIKSDFKEDIGVLVIHKMSYNEDNSNNLSSLKITSLCKHGLKEDDYVNIYQMLSDEEGGTTKLFQGLTVNEIIDDYNFYVTQNYEISGISNNTLAFCKLDNGIECNYYVRLFKRLPNWKYSEIAPTNYSINNDKRYVYNDEGKLVENNSGNTLIDCYNDIAHDFENHSGSLGFARNIYNDEISEIVFTDDIDVSYLKDNLGRPLTDIYLTILKSNKGYKEFYSANTVSAETVEYSHCFGSITQSFKLHSGSSTSASNITKCCMKEASDSYKYNGLSYSRFHVDENNVDKYIDNRQYNEVLYDYDTIFYGDIVCYLQSQFTEEIIDESYFRFNTVQRELSSPVYSNYLARSTKGRISLKYKDNLDITNNINSEVNPFTTVYHYDLISDDYDAKLPSNNSSTSFYATGTVETNASEYYTGYYYKSHYKIPFKTFSSNLSTQQPKKYTISNIVELSNKNTYLFKTREFTYLENYDKIVIYDSVNNLYYDFTDVGVKDRQTFSASTRDENFKNSNFKNNGRLMKVLKIDETVPEYAKLLKDGSFNYIWREVISNGFDNDSDIETYPFTNGAYYINLPINFYLLRQDSTLSAAKNVNLADIEENKVSKINIDTYYEEGDIVC